MSRIAYRALVLLICSVVCVGLIAARPLPSYPAAPDLQRYDAALLLSDRGAASSSAAGVVAPTRRLARPRSQLPRPGAIGLARATLPPAKPYTPPRIPGDGPSIRGTLVAQTERLDLYAGTQTFSADQVAGLAPLLEQILRDDEARFGTTLTRRVSLGFYRPALAPAHDVRGMAYTDQGRVDLFYRPYESPDRAATIAAHELGHHLESARYGEDVQRRADTILHEGLATWIAGDRWLPMCGAANWKERARQLGRAGIPLLLLTAERSGADNAYEQWASFVDFLIERYGWAQLDALYRSGRGRAPGSSNYRAVLGKSLDDLADEWRAWLNQP